MSSQEPTISNPPKLEHINKIYQEADTCDKELFAEQRTNLLLVAGEHYTRKDSKFMLRVRDSKTLTETQKLRITKNHIGHIAKLWTNNLLSYAPDVGVKPRNDKEMCDIKAAELNNSVWQDIKFRNKIKEKKTEWAEDFLQAGEVAVKVFWNPMGGYFVGWEQEVDQDGQPLFEEDGQTPVQSSRPMYSGTLEHERIDAFNLLRDPASKSMDESPWLCYRKMVDIDLLKTMVDDKEKQELIAESANDVFTVFDGATGNYRATKNQALVREFYWRPCPKYPNGWFSISTEKVELWSGELPFGIFPIRYKGFERISTSARCRSWIKHLRPFQVEVNRCASAIAEAQVTLGSDKVLIQHGTKLTPGGSLPGVRGVQFQGTPPIVLPGRGGEQYLPWMEKNIEEMYRVGLVYEDAEPAQGQFDPWGMLFKNIRQKKKFSLYASKFEDFLIDVVDITLQLARHYYTPEMLIPAIGKKEWINIEEFKGYDQASINVSLEGQSEDLETKMGRQLVFNHILQYVGPQLQRDDIGKLIRNMPFANVEESFDDFTLKYDLANADILALDRGKPRPPRPFDDDAYIIDRLSKRMSQNDFEMLPQQVQQMYQQKLTLHEQAKAKKLKEIQAAESGFIPSSGPLITVDMYVDDPAIPGKSRRARLPFESIQWLIKRLEDQGMSLKEIERLPAQVQADIGGMVGAPPTPQPGQGMGGMPGQPQPPTQVRTIPVEGPRRI